MTPGASPLRRYVLTAIVVTALALTWYGWGSDRDGGYVSDFDQVWRASRLTIAGADVYTEPLRISSPDSLPAMGFYYPLTSAVIAIPVAPFSLRLARFVWVGAGVFTFTLLLLRRYSYERLPAVMSGAFLMAVSLAQWAPWIACAVIAPASFAWVLSGKPNVGVAAATATRFTARAVVLALLPPVLAFAWRPGWFAEWQHVLSTADHFRPYVLRPGGALLLLSLFRWRRPEARWLSVIACVPGTPSIAEALVLFAFPMTFRQCLYLALLTHIPNFLMIGGHFDSFKAFTDRAGVLILLFVYIPVLVAVLLRPNQGAVPLAIERFVRRWPQWIRGERDGSSLPAHTA